MGRRGLYVRDKLPDGQARLGSAPPLPRLFTPMTRPLLLALAAALPLFGASCGDFPGAAALGGGSFSVQTDSLTLSEAALNYTVAIGYPQITGSSATVPAETVARVNATIRDTVAAHAASFRPEQAPPPGEENSVMYTSEVSGGTDAVLLRGDMLSTLLSVYAFTGGAHGNTYFVPMTYDLRTGAAITLCEVFQPGTPWAEALSAYAGRALLAGLMAYDPSATPASAAGAFYAEGYDAAAMTHATFALGADSLTVQFAPYEVAAYAYGAPTVRIAYRDLEPFLKPAGPVERIRADR